MPMRDCWFQARFQAHWQRGTWYCFSSDYRSKTTGSEQFPCAIVEDVNGKVHVVRADFVHFGEPVEVAFRKPAKAAVATEPTDDRLSHADYRALIAKAELDLIAPALTIEDRAFPPLMATTFDEECDNNDGCACKSPTPQPGDLIGSEGMPAGCVVCPGCGGIGYTPQFANGYLVKQHDCIRCERKGFVDAQSLPFAERAARQPYEATKAELTADNF